MSQAAPAVALLFDDVELGAQLRDALSDRGARIVYEGTLSSLSREVLAQVGAQVLVVNLDDSADDALDRLYEVIDGDTPRVVFNDAQASRALTGWDRARWARHLAVKVLEAGDLDPPRPTPAASAEVLTAGTTNAAAAPEEIAESLSTSSADSHTTAETDRESELAAAENSYQAATLDMSSFDADASASNDIDTPHDFPVSEQSDDLAAELEALLASGDLSVDEDALPTGSGLRYTGDDELPPLHDGVFGLPVGADENRDSSESADRFDAVEAEKKVGAPSLTPPVFQLDHLELAPLNDTAASPVSSASSRPDSVEASVAHVRAPDSWSLLDDEEATPAGSLADKASAADFGIDKVSASEFLAPDAEPADAHDDAVMSLQLLSMEEAVAPTAFEDAEEFRANRLSQIVLLGAAADSAASVGDFLSRLAPTSRLAFVLTQHLGTTPVDTLVDALAAHASLPVRVATHGSRARAGEVIVVPAGQQLLLIRDGSVELMPTANAAQGPSIDASFSMAANVFGRDVLAIVFAGRGTDAVAGAQAIHDRGGKVWVESSASERPTDMVSGITAERLVSFSGTPHELAAHLIEVFP